MSLHEGAEPRKPVSGSGGHDREMMLQAIRTAVSRSKLQTTTLETIGLSLRQNKIDCEQARKWLRSEGLLGFLNFGPGSAST